MDSIKTPERLEQAFLVIGTVLRELDTPMDADHRTAARNRRSLMYAQEQLQNLVKLHAKSLEATNRVIEHIRSELDETPVKPILQDAHMAQPTQNGHVKEVKPHMNGSAASVVKRPPADGWLMRSGGKTVPAVTIEEITVAPGLTFGFRTIGKRDEALRYPGELCWVTSMKYPVIALVGCVFPAWIPNRIPTDRTPHKVLDHRDPMNVMEPKDSPFYVDPSRNSRSNDLGNFLLNTMISPASLGGPAGTYAIRIGGSETIVNDISLCTVEHLEYALRYCASYILTAVVLAKEIRKRNSA